MQDASEEFDMDDLDEPESDEEAEAEGQMMN
jgi:hypothetical protein